ncbi:hypothetical protein NIES4101_25930 (plasmid) [Calothrix sp. NIES-4101]|nr:hypothetical protein NIES4101_25930 [Calothrix sp. NIES-4101]
MSTNKKVSVLGTVIAVAATSIIPGVAVASQDVNKAETVNTVVNEATTVNKTPVVTEAATVNKTPTVKQIQADSLLRSFGTVTRNGSSPECSVHKLPR